MSAFLEIRLTGGADNADPNASLGGEMSNTELSQQALNNLFDNVSPAEAANGDSEYRAVDIYNSGDEAAVNVEFYVNGPAEAEHTILAGLDSTTQSVADESTAPQDVSFAQYTSDSRLSVPDIPAGSSQRLWLRWDVAPGAPNKANVTGTLAVVYA